MLNGWLISLANPIEFVFIVNRELFFRMQRYDRFSMLVNLLCKLTRNKSRRTDRKRSVAKGIQLDRSESTLDMFDSQGSQGGSTHGRMDRTPQQAHHCRSALAITARGLHDFYGPVTLAWDLHAFCTSTGHGCRPVYSFQLPLVLLTEFRRHVFGVLWLRPVPLTARIARLDVCVPAIGMYAIFVTRP